MFVLEEVTTTRSSIVEDKLLVRIVPDMPINGWEWDGMGWRGISWEGNPGEPMRTQGIPLEGILGAPHWEPSNSLGWAGLLANSFSGWGLGGQRPTNGVEWGGD